MGIGPLEGANVDIFWVFRPVRDRYELILKAPAHNLEIKNTRSHGYREIELVKRNCCYGVLGSLQVSSRNVQAIQENLERIPNSGAPTN